MFELNLTRWNKVWLSKPWKSRRVPGTSMIELHGVRGYLVPGDIALLFNAATALPPGGAYLEVGSWMGLSAITVANGLIANLNFQAAVYCVDTWRGSPEHQGLPEVQRDELFDLFRHNVREAQVDGFVRPVRGESTQVARDWAGPPLDLIFIDGDHSAEGCYQDLRHWHPRLREGGRLLGHDASPGRSVEQGVRRYCAETGWRATVCPLPRAHFVWELHPAPPALPPGHYLLS
jgi:predicted O-methyltransferase YrrM